MIAGSKKAIDKATQERQRLSDLQNTIQYFLAKQNTSFEVSHYTAEFKQHPKANFVSKPSKIKKGTNTPLNS